MYGYARHTMDHVQRILTLVAFLLTLSFVSEMVATVSEGSSATMPLAAEEREGHELKPKRHPAAYFLYMLGYFHEFEQQLPEALALYRQALEFDPDSPTLLASVISIMGKSGNIREAIPLAEEAIKKHPNVAPLRALLGNLYASVQERQAAITQLEEARQLDPSEEDVYLSLSLLYEEERDYETAGRVLDSLLMLQPNSFLG
jgi:tetratricopeptide (TPR) repeat protein